MTQTELMTVREVARELRVDDTTVRRWIKDGLLEAISLPHAGKRTGFRIKRSTLLVLLTSSYSKEGIENNNAEFRGEGVFA